MVKKGISLNNFFIMYFSAALSMLIIFLVTMLVHYESIDFNYLGYALGHMIWLAIPSGVIGILMRKKNLLVKIFFGILIGPTTAFLFIYLK